MLRLSKFYWSFIFCFSKQKYLQTIQNTHKYLYVMSKHFLKPKTKIPHNTLTHEVLRLFAKLEFPHTIVKNHYKYRIVYSRKQILTVEAALCSIVFVIYDCREGGQTMSICSNSMVCLRIYSSSCNELLPLRSHPIRSTLTLFK